MIRYLAIRNLAVIESVAVDFEQSFNILTVRPAQANLFSLRRRPLLAASHRI